MMEKEKIVAILKDYVEICEDSDFLKNFLPLSVKLSFPDAFCGIMDKDGNVIAQFNYLGDWNPSTPVQPHMIAFSKLFVKIANTSMGVES